jgi:hypothetical protein
VAFPQEVTAAGKMAVEMAQDLGSEQARQLERLIYSSLAFAPNKGDLLANIREKLGSQ